MLSTHGPSTQRPSIVEREDIRRLIFLVERHGVIFGDLCHRRISGAAPPAGKRERGAPSGSSCLHALHATFLDLLLAQRPHPHRHLGRGARCGLEPTQPRPAPAPWWCPRHRPWPRLGVKVSQSVSQVVCLVRATRKRCSGLLGASPSVSGLACAPVSLVASGLVAGSMLHDLWPCMLPLLACRNSHRCNKNLHQWQLSISTESFRIPFFLRRVGTGGVRPL